MSEIENPKSADEKEDAELMTDPDTARRCLHAGREAFAQGYDALMQDRKLFSTGFGFRIEDIRPDLPRATFVREARCFRAPLPRGDNSQTFRH
jgi:hypothetical protein